MDRIKSWLYRFDTFDVLSLGFMLLVLGLALTYWNKFPVHMDTYYHIGVTSGYARAGGIALHSFWEFAPGGRAQLYPPLLHVIMFALTRCGLSMATVGRLVSFSAFPLIVLSSWYGVRRLFSSRAAMYTTVVLSSCYLLFWHSAVESAASLVLIITPLVFVAVERNRKVAAAVLLALALYSHLTLGHLVALGLLVYAVHRREKFKEILIVLAGAYVLWLPWGIQIFMNRASLSFDSAGTAGGITVHLLIWAIALTGFVYCYFKRGRYYLLPSFLLGMIPIVFFYPDRFWNAHVFVPLAMLGGVVLSAAHEFVKEKLPASFRGRAISRVVVTAMMAIPVALLLFVDPVYAVSGTGGGPGRGAPQQMISYQQQSVLTQQPSSSAGAMQLPPSDAGAAKLPSSSAGVMPVPPGAANTNQPAAPSQMGGNMPPPPSGQMPPASAAGQAPTGVVPGQNGPMGMAAPGQGGPGMGGGPGGQGGGSGLHTISTTLSSLMGGSGGRGQQSLGGDSVISDDMIELAALIKANSSADEIVHVSDGSLGNMITGLTGRSSTGGMFHEVKSDGGTGTFGSSQNAQLIVVSNGQGAGMGGGMGMAGPGGQAGSTIDTSGMKLIGTSGAYSLYRNPSASASSEVSGTVLPWWLVFTLLALALAAIAADWFRPGPALPAADDVEPRRRRRGSRRRPVRVIGNAPMNERRPRNDALAILPCYNEEGSIARLVAEIRSYAPFLDVLVVDDGSTDATAAAALREGATVLSHETNMGIGAAVRSGMEFALERGYRYAVQIDGDGQHDPRYAASLLLPVRSGEADVAVGSRFMGTRGYRPPAIRRIGTMVLSGMVRLATGVRTGDTTSGFRSMNRKALAFLVNNYPDDYPESESLVLMDRSGVTWTEVPVVMRPRECGRSSIRGLASARFMLKVSSRIVLDAVRIRSPRPAAYFLAAGTVK